MHIRYEKNALRLVADLGADVALLKNGSCDLNVAYVDFYGSKTLYSCFKSKQYRVHDTQVS